MTDPKFLAAFSGWLRVMGDDVLSLANLLDEPEAPAEHRRAAAESLQALSRLVELVPEGIEALGYLEGAFGFRVIAERALVEGPYVDELPAGEDDAVAHDFGAEEASLGERDGDERLAADGFASNVGAVVDHRAPLASGEGAIEEASAGEVVAEESIADGAFADGAAAEPASDEASSVEDVSAQGVSEQGVSEPVGSADSRAPVDAATGGRVSRLAADAALVAEFLGDDVQRFRAVWLAPPATTRAGRAAREVLEDDALRVEVQREARAWVQHYQAPELGDGPEELVKIEAFFRTRLLDRRAMASEALEG